MKLNNIINEDFNVVSIKGILRNLSNDEKKIYKRIRRQEDGKLFKNKLDDFMLRVANSMVNKGVIGRRKNPQGEIYFVCKGRRKTI
jgi:hypothetical protein